MLLHMLIGGLIHAALALAPTAPAHPLRTSTTSRPSDIPPASLPAQGCDLLGLSAPSARAPLSNAWQVRAVRGEQAPELAVIDSVGAPFLRISGMARAAWHVNELASPWREPSARLSWLWRIGVAPAGADPAAAKTDDSALRVFVVFAKTSRFTRTPRTIFYTAQPRGAVAYERPSFSGNDLFIIGIASPGAADVWTPVSVSPQADYQRIWKSTPPAIVAIGFMQDSDQTRSFARADLMSLCLQQDASPIR